MTPRVKVWRLEVEGEKKEKRFVLPKMASQYSHNLSCRTGFSHCRKMVLVKTHDFSRPLVEKGVVRLNRNPYDKVRTHFYHDASTHDWFCDRRVVLVESDEKVSERVPNFKTTKTYQEQKRG